MLRLYGTDNRWQRQERLRVFSYLFQPNVGNQCVARSMRLEAEDIDVEILQHGLSEASFSEIRINFGCSVFILIRILELCRVDIIS